jgi:VWFA-related protein
MKAFTTVFALFCCFVPVTAQTNTDDVVKITTNLVQIDAVVTRQGKQVKDLKPEDFEIFEDGKPQTITSFVYISSTGDSSPASTIADSTNKDSNAPLPSTPGTATATPNVSRRTIALVIDDLALSPQSMSEVRRQVTRLITEQLAPNDLVGLVLTSTARQKKPRFTNDRAALEAAVAALAYNGCSRVGLHAVPREGVPRGSNCGATSAASLIAMSLTVEDMGKLPGRKSMIVFSDSFEIRQHEGLINSSKNVTQGSGARNQPYNYGSALNQLTELAIRSSVVIYAVDASGLQIITQTGADAQLLPKASGSAGNRVYTMQMHSRSGLLQKRREAADEMARETGGYLVHDQNGFQLDQILEDQSGYYLIGYRPSEETFNKKFRKLTARVKKPGLEIRTRSGFFGISEEEAKRLKEKKK